MRPNLMRPITLLCLGILGTIAFTMQASGQDAVTGANLASADLVRGRALYGASCDSCHTQNIHWRDKGLVNSWDTLIGEVTRWQRNTGLGWKQAEINDVAAYLNERFYRLPCPGNACVEKQAVRSPEPPR